MTFEQFVSTLDKWGSERQPFLFIVDFEMEKPIAIRLQDVDPEEVMYDCNGVKNFEEKKGPVQTGFFSKEPISKKDYQKKFGIVSRALEQGDSYLANLTIKTLLKGDISLQSLFFVSRARYKLWLKNSFVVFSPECFVKIRGNKIYTFPMKGTIDASIPDARHRILNDRKELAEHVTIVDLLRNDLSIVADNVSVNRFRYIDEIKTSHKNLLQVSSEITGILPADSQGRIGTLLASLLPAGSVSGAPKAKTVEIIRNAEGEKRGYYTGIFGVYDGHQLDSAVMIRFIEKSGDEHYYRSGGGITTQSEIDSEYQEAIDKVYVPVD